jgi:acyl-CoA dehydrogenase
VLANLPARWAGWLGRALTLPGGSARGPDDRLTVRVANLLLEPSAARDRITGRLHGGCDRNGVGALNAAFAAVIDAAPLMKRLRESGHSPDSALDAGIISEADRTRISDMEDKVSQTIAVDDFSPKDLASYYPGLEASDSERMAAQ